MRASKPENLGKLTPVQARLGKSAGYTLHLIAYSVVPLIFGVIMIVAGSKGRSIC